MKNESHELLKDMQTKIMNLYLDGSILEKKASKVGTSAAIFLPIKYVGKLLRVIIIPIKEDGTKKIEQGNSWEDGLNERK